MKKLVTILAVAAIAITSTFAAPPSGSALSAPPADPSIATTTTVFDGSAQSAPDMNVTLKSSLAEQSYELSLVYGNTDFTKDGSKTIDGLDLTKNGKTGLFKVNISKGNLNKTITFETTISELAFVGTVDNKEYKTNNNLQVLDVNGTHKTSYSSVINAGPQDSQSIAEFIFNWDADTELPAGDYATTNTISISVK